MIQTTSFNPSYKYIKLILKISNKKELQKGQMVVCESENYGHKIVFLLLKVLNLPCNMMMIIVMITGSFIFSLIK